MSAAARLIWTQPPGLLAQKVALLGAAFERATGQLYREVAVQGEAFAKVNAPWSNRTGMARGSLQGSAEGAGAGGSIVLAHGMDYGVWLELANQGTYAILPQALEHMAGLLDEGLSGLLEDAGRGIA